MDRWTVFFSEEALNELQSAVSYYESCMSGLGVRFMVAFEQQIARLSSNPYSRAVRYLEVRLAVLENFPYAIHYVIRENTRKVIVQTVLSMHRDPKDTWKQR